VSKQQVTVPDIGGATGAEVIELLVAAGDEVAVDQGLIVLESDKASMEIPATVAGTVVEVLVAVGQELAEGAPVAVIEVAGEAEAPAADSPTQAPEPGESPPASPEPATAADAGTGDESAREITVSVPDIGTEEAVELIEICVKPGDHLAEGDSLVVLESDKASMEVPAPAAGEVVRLLVSEGGTVRQGDELVVMRVSGEVESAAAGSPAAGPPAAGPPAAGSPAAGSAAAGPPAADHASPVEPPAREEAAPAPGSAPETAGVAPGAAGSPGDGDTVYAGPAVRKLAREFGIELARVSGSGPRGRIVKEDLHRFVQDSLSGRGTPAATVGAGVPAIPEVDFSKFGPVELVERSKLDKLTAANMQRSWLNVPHVTQFDEADITDLEAFRASLKAEADNRGTRLTPMPFLLKACAAALRDNPKFASSLVDGGERLAFKQYCHIGMAVDTPAGLLVPVIRDVDRKSVWELAEEVQVLAARARDRKLSPADMQGGCFTISSLGGIGGMGFTPIVNAPEVGILGVSKADTRPLWDGSAFVPRRMLPLSLSYDHRVINGGDGGRFLTRLVELLGDIRQLVM
jgi:pyruvate dehydrogenase E2 component (dihydrolipoamide acetyltransferase)